MAAYELLARFKDDGTVAGVSIRNKTTVNGKDYEGDPEPLSGTDDPAYTQFATDFSAAVVAERDSLQTQVASLTASNDTLTTEKAALTAQVADLQAQLDELRNPPVDPRHVAPFDFLALFTQAEQVAIFSSVDPTVLLARAQLQTIITYVDLDLQATVDFVNYLEAAGLLAAGRAAQVLAGQPPA